MGKQKITVVKIKKLRRFKRFALEEVAEIKIKLKFEIFFLSKKLPRVKRTIKSHHCIFCTRIYHQKITKLFLK